MTKNKNEKVDPGRAAFAAEVIADKLKQLANGKLTERAFWTQSKPARQTLAKGLDRIRRRATK